jgi:hypothetical protein
MSVQVCPDSPGTECLAAFLMSGSMKSSLIRPSVRAGSGSGSSVLPSPRPWDFPPSIDGDVSREDSPMELDKPEGAVSLD